MKKSVPLVVGNWKLHPITLKEAADLAQGVARKHKKNTAPYVAVAPPFPYVAEVGKRIASSTVELAAQDVHYQNMGAYTGEVSGSQLKDLGVVYVIIGHSERRAMGETDEDVVKKVAAVLKHRLIPIVCIGERKRDTKGNYYSFVEHQLPALTANLSAAQVKKVVIAYEPIWAIGTGETASVDDVKEMQLFIESILTKVYDRATAKSVRLLYGGSVKPKNAAALHQAGGMNGFLVGGASLRAEDFVAICQAV